MALELFAKRSRRFAYCSRYREKIRLALAALATAKNLLVIGEFQNQGVATIFRLLRTAIAALGFGSDRSRSIGYAHGHSTKSA